MKKELVRFIGSGWGRMSIVITAVIVFVGLILTYRITDGEMSAEYRSYVKDCYALYPIPGLNSPLYDCIDNLDKNKLGRYAILLAANSAIYLIFPLVAFIISVASIIWIIDGFNRDKQKVEN